MKNKYNLVLLPVAGCDAAVQYANCLASIADRYLLGTHSLPHVTLYQFEAEARELDDIWLRAERALGGASIELTFEQISWKTFGNDIFWVALLPNHRRELEAMHRVAADALHLPMKPAYDPHMTLINTKDVSREKWVREVLSHAYTPINAHFSLALGHSDDVGQFTSVINSA